jgi:excisionase family DNA binding protein
MIDALRPDLLAEIHRAMAAWTLLRTRDGQALPPGWESVLRTVGRLAGLPTVEPPRLLTIDQAVADYAVSRSALYRWRNDGRLPDRGPGRSVRIASDELEALLSGERS